MQCAFAIPFRSCTARKRTKWVETFFFFVLQAFRKYWIIANPREHDCSAWKDESESWIRTELHIYSRTPSLKRYPQCQGVIQPNAQKPTACCKGRFLHHRMVKHATHFCTDIRHATENKDVDRLEPCHSAELEVTGRLQGQAHKSV